MNTAIFDIDGTITNNNHRQHFVDRALSKKDWKSFNEGMKYDIPHSPVCMILNGLVAINLKIVLCSGRGEEYRQITEEWLKKWWVHYDALYMRPAGDFRSDVIVKRELLNKIMADGYIPRLVVDDRNSVIEMWKEAGLFVFAVNGGSDH